MSFDYSRLNEISGKSIKHLLQERADLANEGKLILVVAQREKRALKAEEKSRLEAIKAEREICEQGIGVCEREREAELKVGARNDWADDVQAVTGKADRTYTGLFGKTPGFKMSSDGWKSFGEMAEVISRRQNDKRLNFQASLNEAVPSEGGFAVPTEYAREIYDIGIQESIVLRRAKIYGMTSDSKKIPAVSIESHASSIGGVTAAWTAEGGSIGASQPKLRSMELIARKLAAYCTLSNEWFEDAISSGEFIRDAFGKALGWYLDRAFLIGEGAGQPLGVKSGDCVVTVDKVLNQANDTIVYDNLTTMESRLAPGTHKNAIYVVHPTTIPELRTLTVPAGTGGSLVQALTGTYAGGFYLNNFPCEISEHMSPLGDLFDICLMDLTQYAIGLRRELVVDASIHVGFQTDEQSWRAKIRADGQPLWDKALTLADGATTVSPFVTLQAR